MNTLKLITLLFLFSATMIGCERNNIDNQEESDLYSNDRPIGEMKGVALINKHLRSKIKKSESGDFNIASAAGNQIKTMGIYLGLPDKNGNFSGGLPGPFGIVLWHQVIDSLATSLGNHCKDLEGSKTSRTIRIRQGGVITSFLLVEDFSEAILDVCQWNEQTSEKVKKSTAKVLWKEFMGFGSEASSSFIEMAKDPEIASLSKEERLRHMFTVLMFEPEFLLSR